MVKVDYRSYQFRKCIKDSLCAIYDFTYPVFSEGPDAKITANVNDSIAEFVKMVAYGNSQLPLREALDSAAANFYLMLEEQHAQQPEFHFQFVNDLKSKVVLNTGSYVSIQLDNYNYTGGAHGMYGTVLATLDMRTGRFVPLEDIIADTTGLRPLLEAAFLESKKEVGATTIAELTIDNSPTLALPMQWCVVPEGVRFIYNPYEVTAYALGQTDITLTWRQLGKMASEKKWRD